MEVLLIICETVDEAYTQALYLCLENGEKRNPRNFACRELRPFGVTIKNPNLNIISHPSRCLNYYFMAMEFCWMITGSSDVKFIERYNKNITKFSDDGHTFYGAYGPRLVDQISQLIKTLKKDPDSRQAVLTLWRPNPMPSKDTPCTVMFHFLQSNGKLDLVVYMRSNDLWLGVPYDWYNFTTIQKVVASAIDMPVGEYHHLTGSMHIYERDLPHIEWFQDQPRGLGPGSQGTWNHLVGKTSEAIGQPASSIFSFSGRHFLRDEVERVWTGPGETWPRVFSMKLFAPWSDFPQIARARKEMNPTLLPPPFAEFQIDSNVARKQRKADLAKT